MNRLASLLLAVAPPLAAPAAPARVEVAAMDVKNVHCCSGACAVP